MRWPGRAPRAPLPLTHDGLFRHRGGRDKGGVRAGPGDHLGEVRVAQPRAELREVRLQGPGALVLLCGRGRREGGAGAWPQGEDPAEVDGLTDGLYKCQTH